MPEPRACTIPSERTANSAWGNGAQPQTPPGSTGAPRTPQGCFRARAGQSARALRARKRWPPLARSTIRELRRSMGEGASVHDFSSSFVVWNGAFSVALARVPAFGGRRAGRFARRVRRSLTWGSGSAGVPRRGLGSAPLPCPQSISVHGIGVFVAALSPSRMFKLRAHVSSDMLAL